MANWDPVPARVHGPERTRMKAMIRSIRSDDAISAATWCPTAGSPGELVSSAESRSGISGASMAAGEHREAIQNAWDEPCVRA